MSNNADFEQLARELRELGGSPGTDGSPGDDSAPGILVMRRLGLTPAGWREFCRRFPPGQWCAAPLTPALAGVLEGLSADIPDDGGPSGVPDVVLSALVSLLSKELLLRQLERELHRLNRSGGELTLVCGGVFDGAPACAGCAAGADAPPPGSCPADLLDRGGRLLRDEVLRRLETCDSMGSLDERRILAILPGCGVLRGRMLAERARSAVLDGCGHPPEEPGGDAGGPIPAPPVCVFGVLTVTRGDRADAERLVRRAMDACESAREAGDGVRYDYGAPLSERATLVHSQEKRFLFFGGE